MSSAGDPAPNPHATAEEVEAARHDRKLANVLYHDWEAGSPTTTSGPSPTTSAASPTPPTASATPRATREWPYGRALELGCGTGFFLLNLMQAGLAERGAVTDLSPGMVAAALRNAEHLGLDVDGRVADAEQHPLRRRHVRRRRRPRGAAPHPRPRRGVPRGAAGAQAGRPVRVRGRADAHRRPLRPHARQAGRGRPPRPSRSCPRCRGGGGRRPSSTSRRGRRRWRRSSTSTCSTRPTLERSPAGAGAADVRVVTEEFSAAMLGWPVRTFEAAVPPGQAGHAAGRCSPTAAGCGCPGWTAACCSRVVPRAWFYNALVTGTKPRRAGSGSHR